MNAQTPEKSGLLRVACMGVRNTQQLREIGQDCATGRGTNAQHTSLKALALLALARNKPGNSHATDTRKTVARGRNTDPVAQQLLLRAIVQFRMRGDVGWATALGAPDGTAAAVIADLRARHGDRVEIGDVREVLPIPRPSESSHGV